MTILFLLLRFLVGVSAGMALCSGIFAYLFGEIEFLGLAAMHLAISASAFYLSRILQGELNDG